MKEENVFFTIDEFCVKGKWPSTSCVRALIYDCRKGNNDFEKAFVRVGRRILINSTEFWRVVKNKSITNNDFYCTKRKGTKK